jgi:hypothetical protein
MACNHTRKHTARACTSHEARVVIHTRLTQQSACRAQMDEAFRGRTENQDGFRPPASVAPLWIVGRPAIGVQIRDGQFHTMVSALITTDLLQLGGFGISAKFSLRADPRGRPVRNDRSSVFLTRVSRSFGRVGHVHVFRRSRPVA